jgi:hypothetical protein
MKFLLIFALTMPHAFAAKDTWWGRFCEKYLVADDPYQYEEVVEAMRADSANNEVFVHKLVEKYREFGASLSWGAKGRQGNYYKICLRTIGRELRRELSYAPSPEIEDILDSYSKFEK